MNRLADRSAPAVTRHSRLILVATFALVFYAQWGTGIATDDFGLLLRAVNGSLASNVWPGMYIATPLLNVTHGLGYLAIGTHFWGYSLLKAAYLLFAIYAAQRFLSLHVTPLRAWLGALLLLLSPLNDGATLWFAGQYLILSLGFYCLAYVRADQNRPLAAFVLALCGSFISYGSTPLAAGLGLRFGLDKRWRAAALMLAPNVIYSCYYVYTSAFLGIGTSRLPGQLSLSTLAKSYLAQVASFLDATAGPSALLKYVLSLGSLSWMSFGVSLVAAALLWRWSREEFKSTTREQLTSRLLVGFGAVAVLALGLFALTSSYPQMAFNLGNRTMIFGNLFLVALLLHVAETRVLTAITAVSIAAFLGLGDHWATWNRVVMESAARIRSLEVPMAPDETLFVRGLQYSQLGPMTHIDHFTATYVVRDVFGAAREGRPFIRTASFNRRLRVSSEYLVDIKYGDRVVIGESIWLYDAERNTLARIERNEIAAQLAGLPSELRHWTQLVGPGALRDTILTLMPRLAYAYGD